VYGTAPPPSEFRWEDVQSTVDREPTRPAACEWEGIGTVEAWTTPFDRDGRPQKAYLAVRTPDESRALALIPDAASAELTVRNDIAGAKVAINPDGTASLQ
jgi:acetyl-CoA C-acetyltransferase